MSDRPYDLVAFDVDGTLVQGPEQRTVWEVLNLKFAGRHDVNAERFARYRRGELSYEEWVGLDVSGWKEAGARRSDLIAAFGSLHLVPGAREALSTLKQAGCRLYTISGTLDLMLDAVYPDHPFEEVFANRISFDAQGCIAHWQATPYDMEGKARILRALALREGVPLSRCAFVGDSANDVWVAREAGFTVAVNPNSRELERIAGAVVRSTDLREILRHLLPEAPEDCGAGEH